MDPYDASLTSAFEQSILPPGYQGNVYNMSYKWSDIIPNDWVPRKILEIGSYHGANTCSLFTTYACHPESEVHCVDPWSDYDGYDEYRGKQVSNYALFIRNISRLTDLSLKKIHIHRMLSQDIDTRFKDETFDIIYVDGNHKKRYVLEDAILSFKKLKPGGFLIFDDLQDPEVSGAIQLFLAAYAQYFEPEGKVANAQLFLRKNSTSAQEA